MMFEMNVGKKATGLKDVKSGHERRKDCKCRLDVGHSREGTF